VRGVRAFRQAPLVFLVALLVTCDFSLKFEQPAVELDVEAAFVSSRTFEISYKFITEEPVLRCRYTVNEGSEEILSNVSGLLTPGVLYTETIQHSRALWRW
jgi:hypothetical protein